LDSIGTLSQKKKKEEEQEEFIKFYPLAQQFLFTTC
jgi:hypothetical protein